MYKEESHCHGGDAKPMKKDVVIDYNALGKRIHAQRLHRGLSQQELSELAQLEPSNISHIERGVGHISLNSLLKIAIALEATPNQLLQDSLPSLEKDPTTKPCIELKDSSPEKVVLYQTLIHDIESYLNRNG